MAGSGIGERSGRGEGLQGLADEEMEDDSVDEKVGEKCLLGEGVHCEEALELTDTCSVLLVHHHLLLLRARLDARDTALLLGRGLAGGSFRRPVQVLRSLHGERRIHEVLLLLFVLSIVVQCCGHLLRLVELAGLQEACLGLEVLG